MLFQKLKNHKYLIRRIILTAILLSFACFCFSQRNCFLSERKMPFLPNIKGTETNEVSVIGSHEIRQRFVAEQDHIGRIRIFFSNPDSFNTTGDVTLTLEDADGNKIADTSLSAEYISPAGPTIFYLGGSSEGPNANGIVETVQRDYAELVTNVEKGKPYVLVLSLKNIKSGKDVGLIYKTYHETDDLAEGNALEIDGKEIRLSCMKGALLYRKYSKRIILSFVVLLLTARSTAAR